MKSLIQKGLVAATTAATVLTPLLTHAQFQPITPNESGDIFSALESILTFLFAIAGALAVLYLIYGGILYITGGAKGGETAKNTIINAIIGVVVILLSDVILNTVIRYIGGA